MLVYNQILEDYKAFEIAEEYNISEEEAAKMYFENIIEDDNFSEEDIKYNQFVCTMDEIGCDLYKDYGAGYYFAVKSNRMNESRLRHLIRESLVRKVLRNLNENDNMNKNRIRLSESQLHRVINESVKRVLKEKEIDTNYDGKWDEYVRHEMFNLSDLETKVPVPYRASIHSIVVKLESILDEVKRNREYENWK